MIFVCSVVGGWANNRTLIRRRRQDLDLTTEYTFNVLRKDDPLKLLIEIATGENNQLMMKELNLFVIFDFD